MASPRKRTCTVELSGPAWPESVKLAGAEVAPHRMRKNRTSKPVLGRTGAKAKYTYDFGDGWEHSIVLEKRLAPDPNLVYPTCTDGRRACPPEDCGGVGGFYALLDAISDPHHKQHEEMREWVGDDYDPEVFSIDTVNRMLEPSPRRRGKASKS